MDNLLKKKQLFALVSILIVITETLLCFFGPMAMNRKPKLIVAPLFSMGLKEAEAERITAVVQRLFAQTKSFTVYGQNYLKEYLAKNPQWPAQEEAGELTYLEYLKIALNMGMDRVVTGSMYASGTMNNLTLVLWDVKSEASVKTERFNLKSWEDLFNEKTVAELGLIKQLTVETKGITPYDSLYFVLLGIQLLLAVVAFRGGSLKNYPEIVMVPALAMFLFAYIYALNANMDYVQRFIASQGQLTLAQSTAREQAFAIIRFLPLFLINFIYYLSRHIHNWKEYRKNLSRQRQKSLTAGRNGLVQVIRDWAMIWTVLSALLYSLAFPSFLSLSGWWPLAWVALVPLFLVLIYTDYAWALFYGVTFGALQTLILNFWQGTYSYISLPFTVLILMAEYFLFMLFFVWLIKRAGSMGFFTIALGWVVFEYLRSVGFLGYPWGLLGTSQYPLIPLIQVAALTGVWGVSFLVVLFNAALAWVLAPHKLAKALVLPTAAKGTGHLLKRFKRFLLTPGRSYPLYAASLLLLLTFLGGGLYILWHDGQAGTGKDAGQARIVLIQQNTDPRKDSYRKSFDNLIQETDKALSASPVKPDLVVWSEGAFWHDVRRESERLKASPYYKGFLWDLLEYLKSRGVWILTGAEDHEDQVRGDGSVVTKYFNSSVLFDPQGNWKETYHKIHLVPFTEYFPFKEQFPQLAEILKKFDASDWDPGQEKVIFRHPRFRFITPICYEDVFPDDIRRFIQKGVDIIIVISNDYWSLSPVEGKQHGVVSLFRAVENQRPLLRATASGYTVSIDAQGRIQKGALDFYKPGYILADVPLGRSGMTLYTRWGDWFPLLAMLLLGGWLAARVIRYFVKKDRSAQ